MGSEKVSEKKIEITKVKGVDNLADPMTKIMEPDKLVQVMQTGYWNIEQPIESVLKKKAKQLARRKTPIEATEEQEETCENGYGGDANIAVGRTNPDELDTCQYHYIGTPDGSDGEDVSII